MDKIMNKYVKFAAIGAIIAVSACSRPAGQGPAVTDPYGTGNGGAGVGGVGVGALNSPEYFRSTIGDTVLFPLDQSTLTPEARQTLTGQAGWLNQNLGYATVIEGHADEQGTREYNIALGARRASSVQEYLISQGVAANRIRTVSYGKERPLAICSTEECYTKNRRAVTAIHPEAGS